MDEYIKREGLLKILKNRCKECDARYDDQMCAKCGTEDTIRMIKRIPAADVEPVIRCKDCEHAPTLEEQVRIGAALRREMEGK